MTYEKRKIAQNAFNEKLSVEAVVLQIERVTNGEGTPYSNQPFSHEPPGVIQTIIRRYSFDETISNKLKARLKLCDRRLEYIVNPSWHEGYNACSSLKKHCQLEREMLTQTGYIEALYRYPVDQAHWYWFLAGWLAAC
jgi:hypothetical protein